MWYTIEVDKEKEKMKLKTTCTFILLMLGVCSCAPKENFMAKSRDELAAEYMAMPEYAAIKLSPRLRKQIIFELRTAWQDFEIHDGKFLWVDYGTSRLEMTMKLSDMMIPKIMEIAKNCPSAEMHTYVLLPTVDE